MTTTSEHPSAAMTNENQRKPPAAKPPRRETFRYMQHKYVFDVNRAAEVVADGRRPVELADDSVRQSVRDTKLNSRHVAETEPDEAGIVAHVFYRTEDGELLHGQLLIDGHHRAAHCLQLQRPFRAFVLTEAESLAVLLRCPDGCPTRPEDLD